MSALRGCVVRDAIAAVRNDGRQRTIRCPAHDDRQASLSIGRGNDGRLLLHCQAGCKTSDVLAAARLSMRDLFERKNARCDDPIAEYEYCDENGVPLSYVVRFPPKRFKQRRADGVWTMRGVRRVLYQLPSLRGQPVVYIVEGEKDADRLRSIGLVATTAPMGAGKWSKNYTEQLTTAGVRQVVILPDNDDPGRKHAEAVAGSCHAAGLIVKVVELPDLQPNGDVSDWLDTGHIQDDLVALANSAAAYSLGVGTSAPEPNNAVAADFDILLDNVAAFVRRYVVVNDHQVTTIAVWIAHTHAFAAADCTPYLQVTSATKRAGKSRLLEVMEPLVTRPWLTGRTSAAALVRKVDAEWPTLLLDESDAAFRGEKEYAEALRGILNTGYRRSGKSTVCVGQGANIHAHDFKTFCPKAIAGIGDLPDTIADRSIPIQLRRRMRDEPCERWRERDGHREANPLREQLATWGPSALEALRDARPAFPEGLGDRQADVWEPLLAIADMAGGTWPSRARNAAIVLTGSAEDTDVRVELLRDVREILSEYDIAAIIPTKELIEKLTALEDSPWGTWTKGKSITPHRLTRLLGPLGIRPVHLESHRGYRVDAFQEAIARYLPIKASVCQELNKDGPESQF